MGFNGQFPKGYNKQRHAKNPEIYVCMYVIQVAVAFATLELHICE
jgi:hypothetical protein